jgi:hypothetical protein
MVVTMPVADVTRILHVADDSPKYTRPDESTATSYGWPILALVAGPPSPPYALMPVPAKVLIDPGGSVGAAVGAAVGDSVGVYLLSQSGTPRWGAPNEIAFE